MSPETGLKQCHVIAEGNYDAGHTFTKINPGYQLFLRNRFKLNDRAGVRGGKC